MARLRGGAPPDAPEQREKIDTTVLVLPAAASIAFGAEALDEMEEWMFRLYYLSMEEGFHPPPNLSRELSANPRTRHTLFLHRRLRFELARGRAGRLAGWGRVWAASGKWADDASLWSSAQGVRQLAGSADERRRAEGRD